MQKTILLLSSSNWQGSIVFIHGLGGDRVRTWTWEGSDRVLFWPKDLLPQACPAARILSFGYNADFAHFYPFYGPKFISEQSTIDDHSTALFQSLIGLREKTNTVGTHIPLCTGNKLRIYLSLVRTPRYFRLAQLRRPCMRQRIIKASWNWPG